MIVKALGRYGARILHDHGEPTRTTRLDPVHRGLVEAAHRLTAPAASCGARAAAGFPERGRAGSAGSPCRGCGGRACDLGDLPTLRLCGRLCGRPQCRKIRQPRASPMPRADVAGGRRAFRSPLRLRSPPRPNAGACRTPTNQRAAPLAKGLGRQDALILRGESTVRSSAIALGHDAPSF